MNKSILFLSDHYLDPRLRKKISLFENAGFTLTVLEDTRRSPWFKNRPQMSSNFTIRGLSKVNIKKNKFSHDSVVYVSGVKILFSMFFILVRLKKRSKIYIEVPDLPLRSHFWLINSLKLMAFNAVVIMLSDGLIVTSEAFQAYLPKKNILLYENIMDAGMVPKFKSQIRNHRTDKIVIGVVGAIRYLPQLEMLIKFISRHETKYELHIHGGPIEGAKEMLSAFPSESVHLYGPYNYENDIIAIYESLDFIYAVYDSEQLNVRLALPNKLYESALSGIPIIVSQNTFLSDTVEEYNLGFSVPSCVELYRDFESRMLIKTQRVEYYNNLRYVKYIERKVRSNDECLINIINGE